MWKDKINENEKEGKDRIVREVGGRGKEWDGKEMKEKKGDEEKEARGVQ